MSNATKDDETTCRNDDCDEDPRGGEGWDGFCGNCADRAEHALEALGLDETFFEELALSGYDAGDMGPGSPRNGETVTAWAAEDGAWLARVQFPSPGYGPPALDPQHMHRLRKRARRAIHREIAALGRGGQNRALRLHVHKIDGDLRRVVRSMTFSETVE